MPPAAKRVGQGAAGLAALLLATALLLAAAACGGSEQAPAAANAAGSEPVRLAYPLQLQDINPRSPSHGRTLALPELYAENGLLLQFVASWCEVCRKELPELDKLRSATRAPVVLVAADEQGPPDSLLTVASRAEVTAPILYVPEELTAQVEQHYDYEILPATYLIDRQGVIRRVLQGAVPQDTLLEELRTNLQ